MKNKKKEKSFDSVKFMRKVRDKNSEEIADMSNERIKEYFSKKNLEEKILTDV